jgi:hypothetical protein
MSARTHSHSEPPAVAAGYSASGAQTARGAMAQTMGGTMAQVMVRPKP